jgi:hypothetical protein
MEAPVHLKSQLTCALRSYAVSQRAGFLVNKGCGGGGTVASLGRSRCCWLGLTEGALALCESEGNWQTRKGGRGCGEENLTIRAVPLRIRQKGLLASARKVPSPLLSGSSQMRQWCVWQSINTIAVIALQVPVHVVHKALQHVIGKDIVVNMGTLIGISPYRTPGSRGEKCASKLSLWAKARS